ncbi:hypothetical protein [Micromonospora sp. CP22]|uniref:hypothetical protein n=1 Tax=Micromonospora sp. CP22 TaxID=2580517 RepID=UPI0012BB6E3C|nr:hypothetical protein [Micromonospora sp. CP22]MTK05170.1 hypothetical protein [Micromonospora sp. CP22]
MNRAIRTSITAILTLLASLGLAFVASPASADSSCGEGKFVEKIELVQWGDGHFQVVLTPTAEARKHAALSLNPRDAVVEQWHAIQGCVSGLYGDLADTIWDQLECHQLNSWLILPREDGIWATGSTYELESWRPTLPRWVNGQDLIFTECLNRMGTDPEGPFANPFRPGETDLHQAWDNIA